MHASMRPLDVYCPFADMEARHPGWSIQLVSNLPDGAQEVFLPRRKTLVLSKELHDKDPEMVVAHAVGHLDLHTIGGPFTHEQEMHAQFLATVRLDRERDAQRPAEPDQTARVRLANRPDLRGVVRRGVRRWLCGVTPRYLGCSACG